MVAAYTVAVVRIDVNQDGVLSNKDGEFLELAKVIIQSSGDSNKSHPPDLLLFCSRDMLVDRVDN